ncbi:MAG TPA: hypothetical protein VNR88_00565 [Hyphomicrobium sp.]|nr:hypothetical protein [Hyphomicrobium sp.]
MLREVFVAIEIVIIGAPLSDALTAFRAYDVPIGAPVDVGSLEGIVVAAALVIDATTLGAAIVCVVAAADTGSILHRIAPLFDARARFLQTRLIDLRPKLRSNLRPSLWMELRSERRPEFGPRGPHATAEVAHPSEVAAEITAEMPAAEVARIRSRVKRQKARGNARRHHQARP